MKVAFFSSPFFADCDAPLIQNLQKKADVTYIISVYDSTKKLTLLNIPSLEKKCGLYPATEFNGLEKLSNYVDLNKTYLFCQTTSKGDFLNNKLAVWRLYRFLVKEKFDLIHITWPLALHMAPLYLLRKKMILTVHDPLPHSSNETTYHESLRKIAFRLLNNFIVLNKNQKEQFKSYYHLENKRIFDSRLGVYSYFADENVIKPDETNYILFFGQINSYKGLDILCEAMRLVKKRSSNLQLVVAGKGTLYFDIDSYVKDGTILFKNYYIPSDELAGLIKNALFAVCPYRDATQSGVIMSAYSFCTPVIVTDVGGLPEMVGNGLYGPIVPANDIESLAAAILNLVDNPDILNDYREKINADYFIGSKSWEKIGEDMFNIYEEIVS
jgi:glycosyltransferase involved in cell wall biosynthesis